MLRFTVWLERTPIPRQSVRYLIPIASVGAAFGIVSALQHFSVRDPVILVYLAAIAVSFWYGQKGPGLFAFILSTVCLLSNFLAFEHWWSHILLYDAPTLCLYFGFAWWLQVFAGSRHHLESVLRRNGEELEAAVKARTRELTRINAEYKTILDAAPFGIALLGLDRIVERCNPEYERMIGYGPNELPGLAAPLPEEEREAWKKQEDALRSGQRVVE